MALSPYQMRIALAFAALLAALLIMHHTTTPPLSPSPVLDSCLALPPRPPLAFPTMSHVELLVLVAAALVGVRDAVSLVGVLLAGAWYYASYGVVVTLKHALDDHTCSTHPNSISGHFNFYAFVSLTLLFLSVRSRRDPHRPYHYLAPALLALRGRLRKPALATVLLFQALLLAVATNAYRTYAHGYHSLRQVLYGLLLGLLSHLAFTALLPAAPPRRTAYLPPLRAVWMVVVGAWSAALLSQPARPALLPYLPASFALLAAATAAVLRMPAP